MPAQRTLLLDTNTLLLLYVGLFDRSLVANFKRTRIFTVDDFDLLVQIVDGFQTLVTTPHVLAEVSNLSGQLRDEARRGYFATFARSLQQVDERYVPAKALINHPVFVRLGLTDAGIAELAHRDRLTVLTTDLDLFLWLSKAQVRVFNFNHLRVSGDTL